ncbi:hypothetical protein FHR92_005248 [Fontibacillus solani]|uniref:Uncharacterized protein n=1 Tax=Fontibacillus solani TaxID=1572857 RepID=A0A7W3XUI0_9BACL|nr:hypothetical protein [Fontibacillus solani]MBA9088730.1 hypothetical protein [Fontibacillus solani]
MVNESPITTVGNLLMLPDLEEQTVKEINQALRQMLGLYIRAKPPDATEGEAPPIDPFSAARRAVTDALGPGVFEEWMEGEVKKDG